MSRWTLRFALALACWLPLQTALAWLPVQQPDRVDVSASDSSRTSSSSAQELGAVAISDCHGMAHSPSAPAPVVAVKTTDSQHACSSLTQWMPHGCKHCTACVLAPADLPRMAYAADWVRRQPTGAPEFKAAHYANFIPGIPVPPPLSFHGLTA